MLKLITKIVIAGFFVFSTTTIEGNKGFILNEIQAETVDSSKRFINGWEYQLVQANNGHPFVFSKIWQYGRINSDLGKRDDLLMNYDIFQDVLVIQVFRDDKPRHIVLNPCYIKSFEIEGHKFVNPGKNLDWEITDSRGYYELIYDSDIKFFVKRIKKHNAGDGLGGSNYDYDMKRFILLKNEARCSILCNV